MKRLQYLFTWAVAQLFKSVKRRVVVVVCTLSIFTMIISWRFMCLNVFTQLDIQDICIAYSAGLTVGSLCHNLCNAADTYISCRSFYQEAMISGSWVNQTLIFKRVEEANDLAHLDATGRTKFPSEKEFSLMIKNTVKEKFNISINETDVKKMSYLKNQHRNFLRHVEMQIVWSFLQDNEYLATLLYEKYGIFPKVVGTCGPMFAIQKLESISGYWHLMTLYESVEEWDKRVTTALMILDYILFLDERLPEPLHMCSVRMSNFGFISDPHKILYQYADTVHPRSVVDRITGNKSECKQHSDCDYYDCRSFCNLKNQKCDHGVVNNNLQRVCERIFLGWVISGRVMVPGLLLGSRSPKILIHLLELCANPEKAQGTPRAPASKDIRQRIYDLLSTFKLYSAG